MVSPHDMSDKFPETADIETASDDYAKRFAGALLLPKETFVAAFGSHRTGISLVELIELKVDFGASIWAIMMRARQLALISDAVGYETSVTRPSFSAAMAKFESPA